MPGWAGSDRKATLPDNWQELRRIVLERSGGRCERIQRSGRRCWDPSKDVDHIVPHFEGGSDDISNLMALCSYCHLKKSGAEGRRGRSKAEEPWRKLLRREPEKHPGSINPNEAKPSPNKGF